MKATGPLSYVIQLETGKIIRRHVDHVKKRDVSEGVTTDPTPETDTTPDTPAHQQEEDTADLNVDQEVESEHTDGSSADNPENEIVDSTQPRRSAGVRKPPNYFSK